MDGGPATREAWLHANLPTELWARGLFHGLQLVEDQMRATLAGEPVEK